ncbi:MAG: hypothetical protein LAP87_05480 [Acidobacteriia bacterium]|nr:hypothetical protein [Terriglobia bacterium]
MDMQAAIKELQETAIVMAGIQSRQAAALKDHAEWLIAHERAMAEIRENGRKADERNRQLDERIEKLVTAIGALIRERNGKQQS